MDNENEVKPNNSPRPPRGPGGRGFGGPRGNPGDKAKDFKGAMIRLFSELKAFKYIVIFAIILAIISSILSISAPSRLSELTDEIQNGLILNQENLQEISSATATNFATGSMEDIEIDGTVISVEDQTELLSIMSEMSDEMTSTELYSLVDEMPETVQELVRPTMNMDAIKTIVITLAVLYGLSAIFSFIQSLSMTIVSNRFAQKLRSRISVKINKLPLKYFDQHLAGDTLSRVTNDVDTIAQSMNQSLSGLVSNVVLLVRNHNNDVLYKWNYGNYSDYS